jgi:multicomponent Na+:H+ antiporter subunit B
MIRRASITVAVICLGSCSRALRKPRRASIAAEPLAKRYVELVPQDLGAPNVITGILLTYRAFDTLGEVAVLFMVAAGVGWY